MNGADLRSAHGDEIAEPGDVGGFESVEGDGVQVGKEPDFLSCRRAYEVHMSW